LSDFDLAELLLRAQAGETITRTAALTFEKDREVFDIVSQCLDSGSPLAPALGCLLKARSDHVELQAEIAAEFAGPKATAKLVAWLPAVTVLLAEAMGLGLFEQLLSNVVVQLSFAVGAALLWLANAWSKRIVQKALPTLEDPALPLNQIAGRLRAGFSLKSAVEVVDSRGPWLEQALDLARHTGAPMAELLDARAKALRTAHLASLRQNIRALSVKLTIPLGAAVLPSMVFLLVIPSLLSLSSF